MQIQMPYEWLNQSELVTEAYGFEEPGASYLTFTMEDFYKMWTWKYQLPEILRDYFISQSVNK